MKSDKIKTLVKEVNEFCQNLRDGNLVDSEHHQKIIMSCMISDCSKSPVFAVAIIQHIHEYGVNLLTLTGEIADAFRLEFQSHFDRLEDNDFIQIKKISNKLFN